MMTYRHASRLPVLKVKKVGTVQFMALSASRKFLAIYSSSPKDQSDSCLLRVVSATLDRILTTTWVNAGAKQLSWVGDNCPVLNLFKKLLLVAPIDQCEFSLANKNDGICLLTEVDGLRVVTDECTYFLDCVLPETEETF